MEHKNEENLLANFFAHFFSIDPENLDDTFQELKMSDQSLGAGGEEKAFFLQ